VFAWAIVVAFWILGVFVGCDFLDRLGHA
jgi:hypothetical protein